MSRKSPKCSFASSIIPDCQQPKSIAPMVCTKVFAAQPYPLYPVIAPFQIMTRLLNCAQYYIFPKNNWRFRFLNDAKHVTPQILRRNVIAMSRRAESLAREASTQHIKSTADILAIQLCNICMAINVHALVHPPILFPLRKHTPRIGHDLNRPNTLVMKQFASIYSPANTGKKVEFLYTIRTAVVCRTWFFWLGICLFHGRDATASTTA